MATLLVNTAPGKSQELFKPGHSAFVGVRASLGYVLVSSLGASFGLSDVRHHATLPEEDATLGYLTTGIDWQTPERRMPLTGAATKFIQSNGNLVIQKTSNNETEKSVYQISADLEQTASSLAYFKIKKKAWHLFRPFWLPSANSAGIYLALRDGNLNTSAHLFLKGDDTVVLAGPLQADSTRFLMTPHPFPWTALADGKTIEFWVFMNHVGLQVPFEPHDVPVVEVWGRLEGQEPHLLFQLAASILLSDPAREMEERGSIFIGNAGQAGDVLEVEDWTYYPDFRQVVRNSFGMPGHSAFILPDAPITYRASDGVMPGDTAPSRWFPIEGGLTPLTAFGYTPGRKNAPQTMIIYKETRTAGAPIAASGYMGFEREEPHLLQGPAHNEGYMIEAFISGEALSLDRTVFGAGLAIEDGNTTCRVQMLQGATRKTYGLANGGIPNDFEGFHLPDGDNSIETGSLKVVRLSLDRMKNRVSVEVDDERIIEVPADQALPGATKARVLFGHLGGGTAQGNFKLASLIYATRYKGYEARDAELPDIHPIGLTRVTSENETVAFRNNQLVITKRAYNQQSTQNYYTRQEDFPEYPGIIVDFRARVANFSDINGTNFAPFCWTGAGVSLFYGRKVEFGFYNCGSNGRRIGIKPGSGTRTDIINQTDLGRRFSADVDWTEAHNYRLIVRAYKSIEVWVDAMHTDPALVIPWDAATYGFDIPEDTTPPSIAFGHFSGVESSVTEWEYVRWGSSNGYDMSVSQSYPTGVKPYHFGGRSLFMASAKDTTDP